MTAQSFQKRSTPDNRSRMQRSHQHPLLDPVFAHVFRKYPIASWVHRRPFLLPAETFKPIKAGLRLVAGLALEDHDARAFWELLEITQTAGSPADNLRTIFHLAWDTEGMCLLTPQVEEALRKARFEVHRDALAESGQAHEVAYLAIAV